MPCHPHPHARQCSSITAQEHHRTRASRHWTIGYLGAIERGHLGLLCGHLGLVLQPQLLSLPRYPLVLLCVCVCVCVCARARTCVCVCVCALSMSTFTSINASMRFDIGAALAPAHRAAFPACVRFCVCAREQALWGSLPSLPFMQACMQAGVGLFRLDQHNPEMP